MRTRHTLLAITALALGLWLGSPAFAQGGGKRDGDIRKEGGPKVGEQAKDMKLRLLGGKDKELVQLSTLWKDKPAVFVFGSYT